TSTTATTVAADDPFAVPEQIDAAYVDRVLVELNRVYGDVVRKVVGARTYDRADLDPLRAIFNEPLLALQAKQFGELTTMDPASFRQPIGDRRISVKELITARPDCIFARVEFDVSAVVVQAPPPDEAYYLTLTPTPADADPTDRNPTPWSMTRESDGRQDPCG
ncbi:MAG: hypothetical protein ACRD0N_00050, partial [Acidimicrobiales bacterium]